MINLHVSYYRRKAFYYLKGKIKRMSHTAQKFIQNPHIREKESKYTTVQLNMDKTIQSWRMSLFSFEWLLPDGKLRCSDEMTSSVYEKYNLALTYYKNDQSLPMPILGIGVMDNIEIGSGKEFVLMLYGQGVKSFQAHITKQDEKEFLPFIMKSE